MFIRFLMLILLMGCSSIHVQTDYTDANVFKNFKRYHWSENLTAKDDALVKKRVQDATEQALMSKGFELVRNPAEKVDFEIDYTYLEPPYPRRAGVHTGVGLGLGSNGFSSLGVGFGSGHRVRLEKLSLRILEPGTNNLLWKGEVAETLKDSDPKETTELFNKAIHAIVEKFPPKT